MDKNFFKLFCIKRLTNRGVKNTVSENQSGSHQKVYRWYWFDCTMSG